MVKIKLITILLLLFCLLDVSFTDINSDLNNRKQELNKLYTNLSNKKAEQAKLLKEEKKVKLELNKIAKSIKNNEKELSYIEDIDNCFQDIDYRVYLSIEDGVIPQQSKKLAPLYTD